MNSNSYNIRNETSVLHIKKSNLKKKCEMQDSAQKYKSPGIVGEPDNQRPLMKTEAVEGHATLFLIK